MFKFGIFTSSKLRSLYNDSLHRNSILLMLDTAVLGILGFIFWLIGTHLYTTEQVGLATALISATSLLASMSLFGFDNSFIRFLPKAKSGQKLYSTGICIVALGSVVFALIFIALSSFISSKLHNTIYTFNGAALFVTAVVFAAFNTLTNGVFLARRSAKYILYGNIGLSLSKLISIFLFAGVISTGIYAAHIIGMIVGCLVCFYIISIKYKLKLRLSIHFEEIRNVFSYGSLTYASNLFQYAPVLVLPLIVIARLGAKQSAVFYLSMMLSNLVYVVPGAVSSSLLAEGSNEETTIFSQSKKATKLIAIILVPILIFIALFGGFILGTFGNQYSAIGATAFKILAGSAVFISISGIASSALKVLHDVKIITYAYTGGGIIILAGTLLLGSHGLVVVANVWLVGQAAIALILFSKLYNHKLHTSR